LHQVVVDPISCACSQIPIGLLTTNAGISNACSRSCAGNQYCTRLHSTCLAAGQLSKCLGPLSLDPGSALQPGTASSEVLLPLQQGCFIVDPSSGNVELLAAARSSGMFQCSQGSASHARNDNKWETWKVVESTEARQALTANVLKEVRRSCLASYPPCCFTETSILASLFS
jgi:hypothetical protein